MRTPAVAMSPRKLANLDVKESFIVDQLASMALSSTTLPLSATPPRRHNPRAPYVVSVEAVSAASSTVANTTIPCAVTAATPSVVVSNDAFVHPTPLSSLQAHPSHLVKAGYLDRLTVTVGDIISWRPKYAVATERRAGSPPSLYLFRNTDPASVPQACIDLTDAVVAKGRMNDFIVFTRTTHREIVFRADSLQSQLHWIQTIRALVSMAKGCRPSALVGNPRFGHVQPNQPPALIIPVRGRSSSLPDVYARSNAGSPVPYSAPPLANPPSVISTHHHNGPPSPAPSASSLTTHTHQYFGAPTAPGAASPHRRHAVLIRPSSPVPTAVSVAATAGRPVLYPSPNSFSASTVSAPVSPARPTITIAPVTAERRVRRAGSDDSLSARRPRSPASPASPLASPTGMLAWLGAGAGAGGLGRRKKSVDDGVPAAAKAAEPIGAGAGVFASAGASAGKTRPRRNT
ncbi:hypothetical protein HK101_007620 [Irineochytrium annulatum]|nr:hypothetical protein HK101_007620 [Irineochytrium annulatum]